MKHRLLWIVVAIVLGSTTPGFTAGKPKCPTDRRNFAPVTSAELQAALDCATPGAIITLRSPAKYPSENVAYVGNFTLRHKPVRYERDGKTPKRITIQTDSLPNLPKAKRVDPGDEGSMAWLKVPAGSSSPVLRTELKTLPDRTKVAASHYHVKGIKFATDHWVNHLVRLGTATEKRVSELPKKITFDRSYFAGSSAAGSKQGLVANGRNVVVTNSYFKDFKDYSNDAQAIIIWNGAGPYRVQNNYLEGSGENMMVGGGDPTIRNLVPSDITIAGNHFKKPTDWIGQGWAIKNLFELKNARRVSITGNVFENNWIEADQHGFAIVFTPRNQSGGCRWCTVEDVTFEYNLVENSTAGINLLVTDDMRRSRQLRRMAIRNNLLRNIAAVPKTDAADRPGRLIQILNPSTTTDPIDVTVEQNTAFGNRSASATAGGEVTFSAWQPTSGFRFLNNLVRHNACPKASDCGISGNGTAPGDATLSAWFTDCCSMAGSTVAGNVFFDGPNNISSHYSLVDNDFGPFTSLTFESDSAQIDPVTGVPLADPTTGKPYDFDYDIAAVTGLGVDWDTLKVYIDAARSGMPAK